MVEVVEQQRHVGLVLACQVVQDRVLLVYLYFYLSFLWNVLRGHAEFRGTKRLVFIGGCKNFIKHVLFMTT
jgi:hypothetical protein